MSRHPIGDVGDRFQNAEEPVILVNWNRSVFELVKKMEEEGLTPGRRWLDELNS